MRALFATLTPEAKLTWVTERRARREYRKPKPAKKIRRTIAALSKAWGVSPAKLEELLTTRIASAKV